MSKKGWNIGLMASAVLLLSACGATQAASSSSEAENSVSGEEQESESTAATEPVALEGTYKIHIGGYDWGAAVDKVTVKLDEKVDAVTEGDFVIEETTQTTDFMDPAFPVIEKTFTRNILNSYLVDGAGKETTEASDEVVLELEVSPTGGSPLLYTMTTGFNTWSDPYYLTITESPDSMLTSKDQPVESLSIATQYTEKESVANVFELDSFQASDGVAYQYAHYEPATKSDTLFIWLHGMGEGGVEDTDPTIALLGNKASVYAYPEFQNYIGGANVIVPQSPTFWMDSDGTGAHEGSALFVTDGSSHYAKSLMELIEAYRVETGATKVVIAGASNGGFMVMRLAIDNPDYFTAAVPICEALKDEFVSDEELARIKDLPLYFVYSRDDTTVIPSLYEEPTIERLRAMGASNLEVSVTDAVVDTSGKYLDETGRPFRYNGHWSWIYFHNNESISQNGVRAWDWIVTQLGLTPQK